MSNNPGACLHQLDAAFAGHSAIIHIMTVQQADSSSNTIIYFCRSYARVQDYSFESSTS